jgi:hypothetical protein
MDVDEVRQFLGWCCVINAVLLTVSAIAVVAARGWIMRFHKKFFGLDESELSRLYFEYLAHYKILMIVFSFTPYFALLAMT